MSDELNDIKGLDIYQDLETKTKTAADEAAQQRRWQHSMSISYRVGVMAARAHAALAPCTKTVDARLGTSSTAKSIDARLGVSAAASEFGSHVRGTVTVATLLKHANALDERLGVSDYSAEFARGFRSGAQDEDTVVAV